MGKTCSMRGTDKKCRTIYENSFSLRPEGKKGSVRYQVLTAAIIGCCAV
jgi:hypothetical protein